MTSIARKLISPVDKWNIILETINRIFSHTISEYSFQQLHDSVYHLVLHRHGELLFTNLVELLTTKVQAEAATVESVPAERILETLRDVWRSHTLTMGRTSDFLLFFNKNYCDPLKKPTVKELGQLLFGRLVLCSLEVRHRISDAFMMAVRGHRAGEATVELHLLKDVSNLLIAVDRRGTFDALIEAPYLVELKEYHKELSLRVVSTENSASAIKQYFEKLEEERQRAIRCLVESCLPKVETTMQEVWLVAHKEELLQSQEIFALLQSRDEAHLRQMFLAYASISEADPFVDHVKAFFLKESAEIAVDNPIALVDQLIETQRYVKHLIATVFKADRSLKCVETLHRTLEDVINRNANTPEALSMYLDAAVKSGDDQRMEVSSDEVIQLLRCLREKDAFESAYKTALSKRLLSTKVGEQDEIEHIFINKFRREGGCNATSKLEGMFSDRRVSEEVNTQFTEYLTVSGCFMPCDFGVSVLTSGFWPSFRTLPVALPQALEACIQTFRKFYLERHNGRKLEFVTSQGTCDVRVGGCREGKRYEVNVLTMCLPVLMVFEDDKAHTAVEVAQSVGLPLPEAHRALAALARSTPVYNGLIVPVGAEPSDEASFQFNTELKAKSTKIRVLMAYVREKVAAPEARQKNDEDRKFKIDAALVRVMKSRRIMDHQALVMEVQSVLSANFKATADEVKRRIEHLIEREFIERSKERRGFYTYLA